MLGSDNKIIKTVLSWKPDWRNIILHDLEKWHEVSNGSVKGKIIRLKM